jgi:hypothetical protein
MKRSVVTYVCDNCGTEKNVEFIQADKSKKDVPLPADWLDVIALGNFGPDKKVGGHYCPGCVRAITFALMEVKLLADTTNESHIDVVVTKTTKTTPPKTPTTKMVTDILQKNTDINEVVDVSTGAEKLFGISRVKLNAALKPLKAQGYEVYMRADTQKETNKRVVTKVLTKPGFSYKDMFNHDIHPVEVSKRKLDAMTKAAK